jgi:hypothetical protein
LADRNRYIDLSLEHHKPTQHLTQIQAQHTEQAPFAEQALQLFFHNILQHHILQAHISKHLLEFGICQQQLKSDPQQQLKTDPLIVGFIH